MIEIASVVINPANHLQVTVTARGDQAAGPLRVQFGEGQPFALMTQTVAPTPTVPGTYTASKTFTDATVFRPIVSGNDHHVSGRNLMVGDIEARDPHDFLPTVAERQAREARKAAQIGGVTGRIG